MLDRCTYLGLVDAKGYLTEVGRKSLETNTVFLPERGRFIMWYTEDPLVNRKLLHLQPVGETFFEDVRVKNGSEERTDSTIELPDKLHLLEGQQLNLLSSESGRTIVYKIERYGLVVPIVANDKLRLTLRVEPNGKVSLTLDGKFKRTLAPPKIAFNEVWRDVSWSFGVTLD